MPPASHQLLIISSNTISLVNHCELIVGCRAGRGACSSIMAGRLQSPLRTNLRQGRWTCGTWRRRTVAPRPALLMTGKTDRVCLMRRLQGQQRAMRSAPSSHHHFQRLKAACVTAGVRAHVCVCVLCNAGVCVRAAFSLGKLIITFRG